MNKRREFPNKVKKAAWVRCGGICECGCGVAIRPGDGPEYDHIKPDFYNGMNDLDNCQVLRKRCHKIKTIEERPEMDKCRRVFEKQIGARSKSGRGFWKPPGYKHRWGSHRD